MVPPADRAGGGEWRRLMPPLSAELVLAQLNRQLAVLEGARAELEVGWVQGGWWRRVRRMVGSGWWAGTKPRAATRIASGAPVWSAPWRWPAAASRGEFRGGTGGRRGVRRAVGLPLRFPAACLRCPRPRSLARVRTLTQWNDRAGRTQAEVLAVVDRAISATIMT